MQNLPMGVYVVCKPFKYLEGEVSFTFRGEEYTAVISEDAFYSFEALVTVPLAAAEAFCGYKDVPVILVPAGVCPLGNVGKTNQERFRTFFPRAVAIFGENVGINPNKEDLRTPATRKDESIIEASYYFGRLCLEGEIDGTFTLDGLTLHARVHDERTGGKDARLVIKNCIIDAPLPQNIIHVKRELAGKQTVEITDCRSVEKRMFYRVEIYNESDGHTEALSNPIWLD